MGPAAVKSHENSSILQRKNAHFFFAGAARTRRATALDPFLGASHYVLGRRAHARGIHKTVPHKNFKKTQNPSWLALTVPGARA